MNILTREYKTYNFDELPEAGKQNTLEKLSDINVGHNWWEFIYDDFKTIGETIGLEVDKIYFSGFWSQGDGACFEGSYLYKKGCLRAIKKNYPTDSKLQKIVAYIVAIQKKHGYKLTELVEHSGRYYNPYCTRFLGDNDELKQALRDLMSWLYSRLEKEYNYLTSKEQIIETIKANEYTFLESGELFN